MSITLIGPHVRYSDLYCGLADRCELIRLENLEICAICVACVLGLSLTNRIGARNLASLFCV